MDHVLSDSESGFRLGSIRIINTTYEDYKVDLRIERNNERVYHDTSEIDADNEVWIEPTWSSEPAEYYLYYVVSGVDKVQIAHLSHEKGISPPPEGDCLFADLVITEGLVHNSSLTVRDAKLKEETTCNL